MCIGMNLIKCACFIFMNCWTAGMRKVIHFLQMRSYHVQHQMGNLQKIIRFCILFRRNILSESQELLRNDIHEKKWTNYFSLHDFTDFRRILNCFFVFLKAPTFSVSQVWIWEIPEKLIGSIKLELKTQSFLLFGIENRCVVFFLSFLLLIFLVRGKHVWRIPNLFWSFSNLPCSMLFFEKERLCRH